MFLLQEEQQEEQQGSALFHPDVSFRLQFSSWSVISFKCGVNFQKKRETLSEPTQWVVLLLFCLTFIFVLIVVVVVVRLLLDKILLTGS